MEFERAQSPIGIQLFGEELSHLTDAAREVEQMGADFVDLNFGCPVPKVVNKGAGSACLKDLNQLRAVIRATKAGISIPLTIKVRTGWAAHTRNTDEVLKIAADEGVAWVAIHGRTRDRAVTRAWRIGNTFATWRRARRYGDRQRRSDLGRTRGSRGSTRAAAPA